MAVPWAKRHAALRVQLSLGGAQPPLRHTIALATIEPREEDLSASGIELSKDHE
jgi:hypothetical protein